MKTTSAYMYLKMYQELNPSNIKYISIAMVNLYLTIKRMLTTTYIDLW